jgi:hypothetical protein
MHWGANLGTAGLITAALLLVPAIEAHASSVAAMSTSQQAPDAGNSQPPIVCDIATIADSIPSAPQTNTSVSIDSRLPAPGEAIEDTEINCTGVEGVIQFTATWTEGSVVLQTFSSQTSQPATTFSDSETMYDGNWRLRTFTICVTVSAPGFTSANPPCNVLQGL